MNESDPENAPLEVYLDAPEIPNDHVKARALAALRQKRFDLAERSLQTEHPSTRTLVENLRIYQAELEIQNDELICFDLSTIGTEFSLRTSSFFY
ncbi:MAG: hypothetical protein GVY22_01820 [Gammaproteobacteria bacterium]|jgi:hypothetical protein|nr:hypothetical protein [Gammaproteobacteria bacterium]